MTDASGINKESSIKSEIASLLKKRGSNPESKDLDKQESKKKEDAKDVFTEINISEKLKDDGDKMVKMSFKDDSFLDDILSKRTSDAPSEVIEGKNLDDKKDDISNQEKKLSLDEIRNEIKEAEKETVNTLTKDDYEMISEFIIDGIDWLFSMLLTWWAKDTTDTPYSLTVKKKEKLQAQLSRILISSITRFNFKALFFISLILAFVQPAKKAFENRKLIKKAEDELKAKKLESLKNKSREIIEKSKVTIVGKKKGKLKVEPIDSLTNKVKFGEKDAEDVVAEGDKKEEVLKKTKVDEKTGKVVRRRRRGGSRT